MIDEIPAVSLSFTDDPQTIERRLEQCKRVLDELVTRDKNHASVILWSVAREPMAGTPLAGAAQPAAIEAGTRSAAGSTKPGTRSQRSWTRSTSGSASRS